MQKNFKKKLNWSKSRTKCDLNKIGRDSWEKNIFELILMVATSFKYYSLKRYYLEQIIMFVHFIAKKAAKKGGAFKALKMLQILNLIILTIFTSMTYLNS